jgi:hypothetical protein
MPERVKTRFVDQMRTNEMNGAESYSHCLYDCKQIFGSKRIFEDKQPPGAAR